ncbi:hypothetical protein KMW28_03635 [Flammeovirga yaeyamensis]|uniref:Lipoprotein n=1 Tax=Flammeovirga yaeyamensis TaxID=367791 RepID=A0AAX1N5A4_9BACT|nr:hypothetical protein [Flammeovirga yaeyamensis]MBB3701261.1 hypothetical protein [Flammeovirga yaeyamensis]NMF38269.1 hypothetical protein [Flammeovirga yaeyamensis]QWG02680.1 hypothetical protein KMW28_03635 [Flammeovirga yaeyamensis]
MNSKTIFLTALTIIITACSVKTFQRTFIGNWNEKALDFSESIQFQDNTRLLDILLEDKYFGTGKTDNTSQKYLWLRAPNNLSDFFDVTKKIGLERLLTKEEYNQVLDDEAYWGYAWKGKSLNMIVDSLILAYSEEHQKENYYLSFWERRRVEKNDVVVFDILNQTKAFYTKGVIDINEDINRNDLYELMLFNINLNSEKDSVNRQKMTIEYFDVLKSNGLEHSAYNLISETDYHQFILEKEDSLLQTLTYDTIPEEVYWVTRNNASWVRSYRDNGP